MGTIPSTRTAAADQMATLVKAGMLHGIITVYHVSVHWLQGCQVISLDYTAGACERAWAFPIVLSLGKSWMLVGLR